MAQCTRYTGEFAISVYLPNKVVLYYACLYEENIIHDFDSIL